MKINKETIQDYQADNIWSNSKKQKLNRNKAKIARKSTS